MIASGTAGVRPELKLLGPSSELFAIDDQNNLVARSAFKSQDSSWWQEVTVQAGSREEAAIATFKIVRDDFIQNGIVAHRGAWKHNGLPQNSIASLQQAILLGCAASEFDVNMSADEVPFVHHDHKFQNHLIEKTAAASLAQLTLANGEKMPTLADYLQEIMRQNRTKLLLEIKTSAMGKERSLVLAGKVVQVVRQHHAQAWVYYISFDYDILQRVLALDPFARVAYLGGEVAPDELASDKFYGLDYPYNALQKNENWIAQAHQYRLTVNSWTVNSKQRMEWLLQRQADFITTDEPELLLQLVNNRKMVD